MKTFLYKSFNTFQKNKVHKNILLSSLFKPFTNTNKLVNSKSDDGEIDDEVYQLNETIKNIQNKKDPKNQKASFELDIYKDVDKYYQHKNNISDSVKRKLKMLSEKEKLAFQKDEDINNFKISPHTDYEVSSIIDQVFDHKTNSKFIQNLDKIYQKVTQEELDRWEKIAKANNIYEIDDEEDEKDVSDFEEEIEKEGIENLFGFELESKINKYNNVLPVKSVQLNDNFNNFQLNRGYEKSLENNYNNTYSKNITAPTINNPLQNSFNNHSIPQNINYLNKQNSINNNSTPQNLNYLNQQNSINNYSTPQNLNYLNQQNSINNYSTPQNLNYLNQQLYPQQNNRDSTENIQQQLNQTFTNSEIGNNKQNYYIKPYEQSYPIDNAKLSRNIYENESQNKKKEKLNATKLGINQTVKNKTYFQSLEVAKKQESFVQSSFINLIENKLFGIFNYIDQFMFERKIINGKLKQYEKIVPFKNPEKLLTSNYEISLKNKSMFYSVSFFKTSILFYDKNIIQFLTSKILASKTSNIDIIYKSKIDNSNNMGYAIFLIYADKQHIATFVLNCGLTKNTMSLNLFTVFVSITLVDLFQLCCQQSNNFIYFQLTMAKQYFLEMQLEKNTKVPMNKIISKFLDGKFSGFKNSMYEPNDKSHFYFEIPNIKFYSRKSLFLKHFNQYFKLAANLQPGCICYKI